MIDYFLKFNDEQHAKTEFDTVSGITPEGTFIQATQQWAIDPVGIIHKPTGNIIDDNEGGTYPEMAPIPGYHVNVRMVQGELPVTLLPFVITPVTPSRVFG